MIRSTGISISRPWTIFQRRETDRAGEARDEVAVAQARQQREALLEAHKEAIRRAFIHGGGWYY